MSKKAPLFLVSLLDSSTENRVVTADCRTLLIVLSLGVAGLEELRKRSKHGTTEPHSITLHVVRDNIDFDGCGLHLAVGELDGLLVTILDKLLNITLKPTREILEHSGATAQHDVLVETTTAIDGAGLNGLIDEDGERGKEVAGEDLGVEEDLRSKETLVTDVDLVGLLADGVGGLVDSEPLGGLSIVLGKLLGDIGAHVGVELLDALGHLERLRGRDALITLTEELLDESSDITTGKRDVLDARADNVTLSNRDNVGHTITTVDNGTGEGTILDLLLCPGGSKSKHGLHGDVETGDVEGLEEDLCKILTVLGSVQRRLSEKEVVILGLGTEILEDNLLPHHFHVGPVIDLTVADRIAKLVALGCGGSLLTDVEVKILDTLCGHALNRLVGGDGRWDDEARLIVASITHLCVASTVINNNCRKSRHYLSNNCGRVQHGETINEK
jgi:hypothetical protein